MGEKPLNRAAWLVAAETVPLEVKDAPYTPPEDDQVVIKVRALAINPVDWAIQAMGSTLMPAKEYPAILGGDLSGEVWEVGASVRLFKKGDRVAAFSRALLGYGNSEGAFQKYVVVRENLASKIPDGLSFENASVVPLCLTTAATGLFHKTGLGLEKYPTLTPQPNGKAVLIWGGSSSVGCNAIQLAVAAGYEVITTASPRNFEFVKKLGASIVFDYKSSTVVDDLIQTFKGKACVGALAIGDGSGEACVKVVAKSDGVKFVALANMPEPTDLPDGVQAKFFLGSDDKELSDRIYVDFLPDALAQGKFIAAPDAEVVGKGLEYIQEALDLWKKGVSAKKMVVCV